MSVRVEARENLRLAVPIVLTQIGAMLMGLVDTAIVGRVGETELAGVAMGVTLSVFVTFLGAGVLIAIDPLVSQSVGANDLPSARSALRAAIRLALLLTPPLALLTWASLRVLPLLRVDPAIIPVARDYVIARLPYLPAYLLYTAVKQYEQAMGRTRAAVEAVIIANVVNAFVGWIMVFGDVALVRLHLPALGWRGLGAIGVGVATSFATWVQLGWLVMRRPRDRSGEPRALDPRMMRKLLRVGAPIAVQLAAEIGVFSLVTVLMGRLGGRAAAAHQIALNLASFSFMGALGVSQATSVRVGLSVGASSRRGARIAGGTGLLLGVSSMATWSLVFTLAPHLLARVFTPDMDLVHTAVPLVRIAALFQLFDGAQVVAAGALRGAGDTRFPLVANLLAHWCLGLPLGCALAFFAGFGARGLWYGLTLGLVFVGTSLTWRFFRLTKREVHKL